VSERTETATIECVECGSHVVKSNLRYNGYGSFSRWNEPCGCNAEVRRSTGNTHYAVIAFSGDPAGEHPDESLRGTHPSLTLIACGNEQFCWRSLEQWTAKHPLRMWEDAEVVERHPSVVRVPDSGRNRDAG